jgi:serine/threonine-protein kinase
MNHEAASELSPEQEQELANLLTRLADRVGGGEEINLEATCKKHPLFAKDLRELWGTLMVTQAIAVEQSDLGATTDEFRMPGLELPFDLGDYLLETEIGRGGMGVVYQALRKSDQEAVAIKMILKGDFASDAERQRFRAEADAAGQLSHPNIVPIYEIGEFEGRAFFCMKLIEGQTLAARLLHGPIPSRRAGNFLAQISGAIEYAHSQGVLHRDLKPSNILIDDEGTAYVADFGLAKQHNSKASLTGSGAIIGTPSYMSPEQAAGARGQIGVASDVYSLGAILYHMLTGRPPFWGTSPVDTVLMVLEQDPIAPRTLNRRVDRRLEMISMRCLQKPQDLRYQTAGLLCDDVQAFLDDRVVSAREGRFAQIISNVFRETHHAEILENWGLIWIWHSLVLLVASLATEMLYWSGVEDRTPYWLMWTLGIGIWAIVFWFVRRRMGPVTFVERQIAHVWAAAMGIVAFLFPLEAALDLPVLTLAPMLGLVAAMVFLIKAGILSGSFYIQSVAMFITAIMMVVIPESAMCIFGCVSACCFFFSGLKYYRRKKSQLNPSVF